MAVLDRRRLVAERSRRRALFLESLEPRMMLCAEDLAENNDTKVEAESQTAGGANSANFGTISGTVTRNSLCGLDDDWYRIVTTDAGTSHTTARIDFTHSNGNLDLELYDSTGNNRLRYSSGSYSGRDYEQLSFATFAAGTYFLHVKPQGTLTDPAYSLTIVSPGSFPDDAYEMNDLPAAVSLQPEGAVNSPNLGTITNNLTISNLKLEDEADWYRIVTTDYGTSHDTARIDFTDNNGDLRLELYAADGTTRLTSEDTSYSTRNFEQLTFAKLAPGTYFLKVSSYDGDANGNYTLTIDPPGNTADDAYEVNDLPAMVSAQPEGGVNSPNLGTITNNLTISNLKLEDEADWYRIVTTDYGTSHDTARIDFTDSDGDLRLELYAADGTTRLTSDDTSYSSRNFEQLTFAKLAPGTYFLKVASYDGDANGNYTLTVDPPGNTADDAYEVNDLPAMVSAQPEGGVNSPNLGTITNNLTISNLKLEDEADWYRIVTTDYGTSHDTARIDFTHNDGNLRLELYAADGTTRLTFDDDSYSSLNFEQISFATRAPGTYFLKIASYDGDANGNYTLTIDPPGNTVDDAYEVNDLPANVSVQPEGGVNSPNLGTITNTISIPGLKLEDQADWYRIVTTDYGTTHDTVRIDFVNSNGDLRLELYAADGTTRLAYDDNSYSTRNFEQVSLGTLVPGTYFIKVSSYYGQANDNYTLTIDPPGNSIDDAFEQNDTPEQVSARILGGTNSPNLGPVSGTRIISGLRLEDQVDWYRIELEDFGAGTNSVRIDFSHAQGDLNLELYNDDASTRLKYSYNSSNSYSYESISLAGYAGGVYWIKVLGSTYYGSANESYQLTIDAPTLPAPQADLAVLREGTLVSPTTVTPGSSLHASVKVLNRGKLAANNVRISAYLSTDSNVTTGDRLLGSRTISLAAGASQIIDGLPASIPGDVSVGNYTLGWIVDDLGTIAEPDEVNNVFSLPLVVASSVAATGQIRGLAFNDSDADGVKDTGEAALVGRTVFLDFNQNRSLDAGETTTTTDASGNYTFANLPPGQYRVEMVTPSGWQNTLPAQLSANEIYVSDGNKIVTLDLDTGETTSSVNSYGLRDIAVDPTGKMYGSSGYSFYSVNPVTGSQSYIGYIGSNVTAMAFDTDGTLYAAAAYDNVLKVINPTNGQTTAVGSMGVTTDGAMAFHQGKLYLVGSDNHLYEINKYTAASTDLGLLNIDANYGFGGMVSAPSGELLIFGSSYDNIYGGEIQFNPLKIRYRYDLDNAGFYYYVYGAARLGESGGPVNGGYIINLATGQTASNNSFGQVQLGGISGTVYEDRDLNNSRGSLEPGLAGWSVYVDLNNDNARQMNEPAATTDAAGNYNIGNLLPKSYTVRVSVPPEWTAINPSSAKATVAITSSNPFRTQSFGVAQPNPPQVTSVVPASNASIATGVTQIQLQFTNEIDTATLWTGSFPLQAAGGDNVFDNSNDVTYRASYLDWDSPTKTVTLYFNAPLPRDRYRVHVADFVTDIYHNPLDGEFYGQFPSGNGFEGGEFVSNFIVTNGVPVADNGQGTARQSTPITLTVTGHDPDFEPLTYRIITQPSHGTLVPGASVDEFVYTANAAYQGSDSFTFVANDGQADSAPATFYLNVTPVPADLSAQSLTWPTGSVFFPGGTVPIQWTGQNLGPGGTSNFYSTDWYDSIYISEDATWDAYDQRLLDVAIDQPALGINGQYTRNGVVTLPNNLTERPGDYYLILRVDRSRYQLDGDSTNNTVAVPFQFESGVQLAGPRADSLVGAGQPFTISWRDYSADPAAVLTFAIDSDNDPTNGVGQTILANNILASDEGAGDIQTVNVPSISAGQYYLWGQITDNTGTHYSQPLSVLVTEEAYRDVSPDQEPVGGSVYIVQNVEWGRIGDEIFYHVFTNYDPRTSGGGDLYINVGGDYLQGNGQLVGIATKSRTTTSGLPVAVGRLYTGAEFVKGTVHHEHPTYIKSYTHEIVGSSSLEVRELPAGGPRYEIVGSFFLSAIGSEPGSGLQVGWAMYCGNDFGHAENHDPLPDLKGDGFKRPAGTGEDLHSRWGDTVTINVAVRNAGVVTADPSTSKIYLSADDVIDASDFEIGSFDVPSLAAGGRFTGQVQVTLPATAPYGFYESGNFTIGMIADQPEVVEESNESNNQNLGNEIDLLSLRVGGPAQYVNVLTHGFNPYALDPTGAFFEGGGWEQFLSNWEVAFPNAIDQLVDGTDLADEVVNYTSVWDSTTGWREAAISLIAGLAIRFVPLPFGLQTVASRIALRQIPKYMHVAAALAEQAAVNIVRDITTLPDYLGDPADGQTIHLIGHSRGAAVNARVSELLHDRYGYTVDQYTALDGYSTDWPNLTGILGDIPITVNSVDADLRYNFRVQQSLFEPIGAYIDQVVNNFFNGLGFYFNTDVSTSLLQAIDARAPVRAGFDSNQIILGTNETGPSSHVNVSSLYFDSLCRETGEQYILNSTLAQAAILAGSPAIAQCGVPVGSVTTPPTPTGTPNTPNVTQDGVQDLHNFYGGDFEDLGRDALDVQSIPQDQDLGDGFLNAWLQMVRQPNFLLHSQWNTTGDVQLDAQVGNTQIVMQQSASEASVGQWLVLPDNADHLQFTYNVEMFGPGDTLEVRFGDELVGSWDLSTIGSTGTLTASVVAWQGESNQMTFRLVGPPEVATRLSLDNLAIIAPLTLTGFSIDPLATGDVIAHAHAQGAEDAAAVLFYRETNGIEGLQRGTGGDTLWTQDDTPGDGWSADFDLRSLSDGSHMVYAVAQDAGGTFGSSVSSASIIVNPQPTLTVTLSKSAINENGGVVTGTVTRTNSDNSAAIVVTLVSSLPGDISLPTTVTIPAGQASINFTITGIDNVLEDGHRDLTITASAEAFSDGEVPLTVRDDETLISWQNTPPGDVNDDGEFGIPDILATINYLKRVGFDTPVPDENPRVFVDVNNDGRVNISDLLRLIFFYKHPELPQGESAALATSDVAESLLTDDISADFADDPTVPADLLFANWGEEDE